MNILFMGTSDFAVKCFEELCSSGLAPVAVVSQPDKPKGRGYKLTPSPLKAAALSAGIDVYTPEKLRDGGITDILEHVSPDIICVVAYGKILPKYVLDYPSLGCINVHASILPKYRGAAPINYAIINGEDKTGVSTMYMSEGLDTGDVIMVDETVIKPEDDFGSLHDRLAVMGGKLLVKTILNIQAGNMQRYPQMGESSYAHMIDNSTRRIDFSNSPDQIVNLVRGLSPVPCAYTTSNGKNVKIFSADNAHTACTREFGSVECGDRILVSAGGGTVEIKELQIEGKKRVSSQDFLRGNKVEKFE